jgi:hypothetical protein
LVVVGRKIPEGNPQMSQKVRPVIYGKASTIPAPPQPAPFATEALQEEAKAAAEARIRQIEAANLKGAPLAEERNPSRD